MFMEITDLIQTELFGHESRPKPELRRNFVKFSQ